MSLLLSVGNSLKRHGDSYTLLYTALCQCSAIPGQILPEMENEDSIATL